MISTALPLIDTERLALTHVTVARSRLSAPALAPAIGENPDVLAPRGVISPRIDDIESLNIDKTLIIQSVQDSYNSMLLNFR